MSDKTMTVEEAREFCLAGAKRLQLGVTGILTAEGLERIADDYATLSAALQARDAEVEAARQLLQKLHQLVAQWADEDDWVPVGEEERARYRLGVGKTDELRRLLTPHVEPVGINAGGDAEGGDLCP